MCSRRERVDLFSVVGGMTTGEYKFKITKFSRCRSPRTGSLGCCRRTTITAEKSSSNKKWASVREDSAPVSISLTLSRTAGFSNGRGGFGGRGGRGGGRGMFQFSLVFHPCDLTRCLALVNQVEEIVEGAVGGAAVVPVGEGEHGVLSFLAQFFGFFHIRCTIGGGIQKRGGPPRGRGGSGRGHPGGRGGFRGGAKTILEPHRHPGIFIAKAKESMLVTKNLVPGESVYGEKRISIEGDEADTKVEYRVWNPFRSKLAAGVLGGLDDIFIAPGKKVLYLGAASGTSVSHVADIVGPVSVPWLPRLRLTCSTDPTYSCSDPRRVLSMLLNSR